VQEGFGDQRAELKHGPAWRWRLPRALRECLDIVNAASAKLSTDYESHLTWASRPKQLLNRRYPFPRKLLLSPRGMARWPSLPAREEVS
jgi:hypothetical protein